MNRRVTIFEAVIYCALLGLIGWMARDLYLFIKEGEKAITIVFYGLAILGMGLVWGSFFVRYGNLGRYLKKAITQLRQRRTERRER